MKRAFALLLTFLMIVGMAACGEQKPNEELAKSEEPKANETEMKDQEKTEPENAAAVKPVILCVSFGTSYNDNRDLSIGGVESALQEAFPDREVRRAFTSQIIIDKLKERDKIEIDNVKEAMERLVADGVKDVVIQPSHVMSGMEYDGIVKEVEEFKDKFDSFKISPTLLTKDEDLKRLVEILHNETKDYDSEETAVVWMGHGTEHKSNEVYGKMQEAFLSAGYKNYFVGTVEATPSLDDVLSMVKKTSAKKVVLLPLMIVAGDHANNDMAGDEDDSWKTAFKKAGYEVEPVLKGMGQYKGVQQMIVDHCKSTIEGSDVSKDKREPISASLIKDGEYDLSSVESDSSMFRVVKCRLKVEGEKMIATITMSGQGYGKMFMGTGEAAEKADDFIPFELDPEGKKTFALPIESLNDIVVCSAWSIKKEKWYDRNLVFWSDGISEESLSGK